MARSHSQALPPVGGGAERLGGRSRGRSLHLVQASADPGLKEDSGGEKYQPCRETRRRTSCQPGNQFVHWWPVRPSEKGQSDHDQSDESSTCQLTEGTFSERRKDNIERRAHRITANDSAQVRRQARSICNRDQTRSSPHRT